MAQVAGQTPSQTVGPFFGFALPYDGGPDIVGPWRDCAITVHGGVYDGAGAPVPDAMLEAWQADPDGALPAAQECLARDGSTFTGFGRIPTDTEGRYHFHTLLPGPVAGQHAPHLAVAVFARGVTRHLYTRLYFPQHEQANGADPLLSSLPVERARTLVADRERAGVYRFDVRLQGEGETVFLDFE